jgi:thiamine biosynthesis lipoprotein
MGKVKSKKPKVKSTSKKAKTFYFSLVTFSFFLFPFSFLCGCQSHKQELYKDRRIAMGTFVEVISPYREASGIVFSEIKRIEDLLSKYNPDSEVSRLNKGGEIKASPETFYVIKKAKEFWQASYGAFDITVGPLVDLWGFTEKEYFMPTKEEITKVLGSIGSDKIILNDSDNVVKFMASGMKIDLGAIAKGFAVDCAVKKLKESGIKSCLINAGGQIYCLGEKFNRPWQVAVKNPRSRGFADYLELKDQAVATSGDYEQYFIKNNKRYSHIFNPRTGFPADSGVISVTVIATDGLTADALATAIFVLGKEKGLALADKFPNVKVEIVEDKL